MSKNRFNLNESNQTDYQAKNERTFVPASHEKEVGPLAGQHRPKEFFKISATLKNGSQLFKNQPDKNAVSCGFQRFGLQGVVNFYHNFSVRSRTQQTQNPKNPKKKSQSDLVDPMLPNFQIFDQTQMTQKNLARQKIFVIVLSEPNFRTQKNCDRSLKNIL